MITKKILDCGRDSKQLFSAVNAITNNKTHEKWLMTLQISSSERYKQ